MNCLFAVGICSGDCFFVARATAWRYAGLISRVSQPVTFSSVPIKSFRVNSKSVGAQFFTATVTWPCKSGVTRYGPPVTKGCWELAMLARHKLPSPGGAPPSVLMATLMKATDSGAIVTALQTFKCPVPQLGCPSHAKDQFLGQYHNWCC